MVIFVGVIVVVVFDDDDWTMLSTGKIWLRASTDASRGTMQPPLSVVRSLSRASPCRIVS